MWHGADFPRLHPSPAGGMLLRKRRETARRDSKSNKRKKKRSWCLSEKEECYTASWFTHRLDNFPPLCLPPSLAGVHKGVSSKHPSPHQNLIRKFQIPGLALPCSGSLWGWGRRRWRKKRILMDFRISKYLSQPVSMLRRCLSSQIPA